MKYIWLIIIIYLVYKALSRSRQGLPWNPQPIPEGFGGMEEHHSGIVLAEQSEDGPLSGPWSRDNSPSPEKPGGVEYLPPKDARGKEENEKGCDGEAVRPRQGEKHRVAERKEHRRDHTGGEELPCKRDVENNAVAQAHERRQNQKGICRQNLLRMLSLENIQYAIILAEILGPRGGRRRMR
jgi:hypothetical protein